jgi:hypothetical protein
VGIKRKVDVERLIIVIVTSLSVLNLLGTAVLTGVVKPPPQSCGLPDGLATMGCFQHQLR